MEVVTTHSVLRVSIAALGVAAFVSLFPLSTARADTPPSAATTLLSEPAPTLDFWVESGPDEATIAQHPAARHHARHYARHYAWRDGRRYAYHSDNPVAAAATGVPIWARLRLIHSIASRFTAPALSVGRIGFEARALFA
jgi:hypothetical protein